MSRTGRQANVCQDNITYNSARPRELSIGSRKGSGRRLITRYCYDTQKERFSQGLDPWATLSNWSRVFTRTDDISKMSKRTLRSWHALYRMYTANRDEIQQPTERWREARIHTGCHKCKSSKEGQWFIREPHQTYNLA